MQVLDENQQVIADTIIPGNSTGLALATTFLWNLTAADHPVIYLRAQLKDADRIDAWEVYANDGYKWHFGNAGDAEGWTALDTGATPAATVANGVLRLASTAAGSDPRLSYSMPSEVAAKAQEIIVALRRYLESALRDAQAAGLIPAGDPAADAKALFAYVEGSLAQARVHDDLDILRRIPQAAFALVRAPNP